MSLKNALAQLGIGTDDGVAVYGVGCHGNMYDWMKIYGVAALHGRTLPVAQGLKIANHTIPVIVISGDGDGLGEGGNHFLHAAKRNPDITVFIHDNQVYGLTTGQASPTAKIGFKTKSTPQGVVDEPINPLALALTAGATFVARGFAGDGSGLTEIMKAAITHKGFSVVDILQPCVTFDKVHTYTWYRQRLYKLEEEYKADNRVRAIERAMEWGDKIPLGIFYKEDKLAADTGSALKDLPLGVTDLDGLLAEFI
jgi:2-oxoglutarate ferredoxin oxidoreductase subunit beta